MVIGLCETESPNRMISTIFFDFVFDDFFGEEIRYVT